MLSNLNAPRVPDETPRRVSALEERIELLQELYELAATVNGAANLDEIFQKSLFTLKRVLGAPRASILLFDHEGVMRFRGGTLDDTSWLRPTRHIWTRSKQAWVAIPEGDEVFEGQPP